MGNIRSDSRAVIVSSLAHFDNDVLITVLPAVLPIVIGEFGLSYGIAGATLTAFTLFLSLLQAFMGYMGDRMNRILLLSLGLATLGTAAILTSFSGSYIQFLVFQCLLGVGASVYHPIGYSLTSDTFELGRRGKALGIVSAAGDIALAAAFATTGFLVLVIGWRGIFMFWGLLALISASILGLTMVEKKRSLTITTRYRFDRKVIVRLIPVIIVMGLASACYRIVNSFTTTYLTTMGLDIKSANIVTAFMFLLGVLGSIVVGVLTDRLGERKSILLTMAILGAQSLILTYAVNVYLISIIIISMGFSMIGVWPPMYSAIANLTKLGPRAFTYGVLFAISQSFGSLFPFISGALADVFGLQIIYTIVSILSFTAVFVTYLMLKR